MADVAKLRELLERVEAASGPDRYADCHLWVLAQGGDARMRVCDSGTKDFIWERGVGGFWVRDVRRFQDTPRYTSSLDASIALVERMLPGWEHGSGRNNVNCDAWLANPPGTELGIIYGERAPTQPLAVLKVLLRALISQAESSTLRDGLTRAEAHKMEGGSGLSSCPLQAEGEAQHG